MADIDTVVGWRGCTVIDQNGDKIGKFEEFYLDESQSPAWASVTTGMFGLRQTLIPLRDAEEEGDAVRVPYDKDHVKDAPNVDPDEQLSAREESVLFRHYGMEAGDSAAGGDAEGREAATQPAAGESAAAASPGAAEAETGDRRPEAGAARPEGETAPEPTGRAGAAEPAGAGADAGGGETARAQEAAPDQGAGDREIPLDTEVGPRERVRLKKYVVTDEVTKTVPIEREEVRIEREPFDSAGRGQDERGAGAPAQDERGADAPAETSDQSRGGEASPARGGEAAPASAGEAPPGRGGEAPPARSGEAPPGEAPPARSGEAPPSRGGEAPPAA
jgi:uncharacterized protein DUF2382/PRC-barrel domain protein